MPTPLPSDEVELEHALVAAIRDKLLSVPLVYQYVKIEMRERFPDSDREDELLTTIPDPVNSDIKRTSIIEIGIPTVEEFERTSDLHTQLNFVYPIRFDFEVVDKWNDPSLVYQNSRDLTMAIYMKSRRAFKFDRTFGYDNCVHEYLQQEYASIVDDPETGGRMHVADWSLTIKCTGILV